MEPTASQLLEAVRAGQQQQLTAATVSAAVRDGMVEAVKALASDKEFAKAFWEQGYEQLSNHAGKGASQWVGKRILTALVTAVAMAALVWLVKSGALK